MTPMSFCSSALTLRSTVELFPASWISSLNTSSRLSGTTCLSPLTVLFTLDSGSLMSRLTLPKTMSILFITVWSWYFTSML